MNKFLNYKSHPFSYYRARPRGTQIKKYTIRAQKHQQSPQSSETHAGGYRDPASVQIKLSVDSATERFDSHLDRRRGSEIVESTYY